MISTVGTSTEALVQALQQDSNNISRIYDQLLPRFEAFIGSTARKYARGPQDYEDLAQEGRIALLEAARRYRADGRAQFATYAFRCIRGQLLNWLRRDRRRRQITMHAGETTTTGDNEACLKTQPEAFATDIASDPVRNAYLGEIAPIVARACDGLTETQSRAITLVFWQGYRPADVARRLGVSRPRAHRILAAALKNLRPALQHVA